MTNFYLGLDLGQVNDPTAIAIIEKIKKPTGEKITTFRPQYARGSNGARFPDPVPVTVDMFHLRYLERLPLGTSYPDVVRHVGALMIKPELAKKTQLVVDATGVGRAIVDMLREAKITPWMVAITITGGDLVSKENRDYRVPKRDLVSIMHVLLQTKRLKRNMQIPLGDVFEREMENFRMKRSPKTGHDSYEHREGEHDDLVLAVAMACWAAENIYVPTSGFYSLGPA